MHTILTLTSIILLSSLTGEVFTSEIFDFRNKATLDISFKKVTTKILLVIDTIQNEDFMNLNTDKYFSKIYREEKSTYFLPMEDEDDNLV